MDGARVNAIKVFQVTNTDWVAATTAKEAKDFLLDQFGFTAEANQDEIDDDFLTEPHELTPAEMESYKHRGDDGVEYDPPISFREELERNIAEGIEFPCMFATTEI